MSCVTAHGIWTRICMWKRCARPTVDFIDDQKFAQEFTDLFKLESRGSLVVRREMHSKIKLFAVRFAHKIRSLSGLQAIVPRLQPGKGNGAKNKVEMFRLFVSVYPAYCNLCKNMGWKNQFYWNYAFEDEEDVQA